MSRTVDSIIGVVGREDGDEITVEVEDGRREALTWCAGYRGGTGAWIGDNVTHSMRTISGIGVNFSGNPDIWRYPANHQELPLPEADPKGFGFQIHTLERPGPFIDAGLSLQEELFGMLYLTEDTDGLPQVAMNWYSLARTDQFLTPVPDNFGVPLVDLRHETASYVVCSSGWQNSAAEPPSPGANWYPEIYGTGPAFNLRHFYAARRWVAGDVGGAGLTEQASKFPPIDDVTIWLDARSIPVADLGHVSEWPNYSGRGGHPVQTTALKQPVVRRDGPGGLRYVRFDGSNDLLTTALTPVISAQPYTVFMVLRQNAGGSTQEVWAGAGQAGQPLIYKDATTNNDEVHVWAGSSDLTYRRGAAWPMPFTIWSVTFNGANSTIWENLTLKATGDGSHPGSGGLTGLTLGNNFAETLPAKVDIAAVIVAATGDEAQRAAVVNYLNDEFGVF